MPLYGLLLIVGEAYRMESCGCHLINTAHDGHMIDV